MSARSGLARFMATCALGALVSFSLVGAARDAAALTIVDAGYLDRDTTWGPTGGLPADAQYLVTQPLRVDEGFTLTVEPGTTIRFASGAGLQVGTGSTGRLRLLGTAAAPVVLRPDSNTPGDWTGVRFTATAVDSLVQHARIERATIDVTVEAGADVDLDASSLLGASQNGLKLVGEATPAVTGTTIASAGGSCVVAENQTTAPAVFSGNTIGPCGDWLVNAYPQAAGVFGTGTAFVRNTAPTERNAIYVNQGAIRVSTTWPALTGAVVYYAPYGFTVAGPDGPVWTVEDGAVVKMNPGSGYTISIGDGTPNGSGGIAAEGVTFTSYRDDSVGGDTTADGETQPAAGDIVGLSFREYVVAGSYVRDSDLRWCGHAYGIVWNYTNGCVTYYSTDDPPLLENVTIDRSAYYGVHVTGSSPILAAVTVTRSANAGIVHDGGGRLTLVDVDATDNGSHGVTGLDATVTGGTFARNQGYGFYGASVTLTGATFEDNASYPLAVAAGSVAGAVAPAANNVFVPNSAPARFNGIVALDGTIAADATWPALPDGFAYLLPGTATVAGAGGPVLRIEDGAVVKMGGGGNGLLTIGSPTAATPGGLVAEGVTFTSYRDDTAAGDTNGDGASAPAPGDYVGLVFREYVAAAARVDDSTLRWCGRYGVAIAWNYVEGCVTYYYTDRPGTLSGVTIDRSGYHGLRATSASPTLDGVTIARAGNVGLLHDGTGTVTFDGGAIEDSGSHGLQAGAATVTASAFRRNGGYGLYAPVATVTGSTFERNASYPAGVGAASVAGVVAPASGNVFVPNAAPARFNALDVLDGTIATDALWPALPDGFAYRVGGQVSVSGGTSPVLAIASGAILKMGGGGYGALHVGSAQSSQPGGLVAEGVTFTSYRDDTVAGDTTGDGATQPARGDFSGLVFREYVQAGSAVTDSTLRWCGYTGVIAWNYTNGCVTYYYTDSAPTLTAVVVERSSYYGVRVTQSSPSLTNVTVRFGADAGLYADGAGTMALAGLTAVDNAGVGAYLGSSIVATVTGSTFERNGSDGLHAWTAAVTGTRFADNGRWPVAVAPDSVETVVAADSGNTLVPNEAPARFNAVHVQDGTLTRSATWPALDGGFVYYLPSQVAVAGPLEPVLTIEDGAVVKLGGASYGALVIGSAASASPGGLAASGVTFTSYRDDSLAGDTTGDGDTPPARGDHAGLVFREYVLTGSSVAVSRVAWCGSAGVIAWNYTNGCVTYYYTDHPPALTDVVVDQSSNYGVRVTGASPVWQGGALQGAANVGL